MDLLKDFWKRVNISAYEYDENSTHTASMISLDAAE